MTYSFRDFYDWLQLRGLEYHHRFYGVYAAQVVNVEDPQKQGRIQVICEEVGNTELNEVWAYPAFAGAGADRGWFWPPEVGDTVWIAFPRGGLTDQPIYFGSFYGTGEIPPELGYPSGEEVAPTRRGFVTRGGHTFVLNDESGSEAVELVWRKPNSAPSGTASADRTGEDASLKFTPEGSVQLTAANDSKVEINTQENKITITEANSSNTITIDSNGITIKTSAKVVVDGASEFSANANQVNLGSFPTEPAVLGQSLLTWLTSHVHPTGVGPSGPPTPPPTPAMLSTVVKVK